ncbi:LysR substrate-binding domain-containing protein [Vibrio aestuarianus]|uniref:LysR substrate-binding domain-containing protein n=1 Tax=Vibrio aestuarianus TaxID=28171 RepID=A0ABD7YNW6_9VIBR|nr:LysR substrate-binding domain-containing protein [Vibrio aestuarianus]WGK86104.1 LysR substrate-binding domain-containing protein [Vibrio aestuarianus]CAH8194175.1 Regulator [Vibrio aestuarianus]
MYTVLNEITIKKLHCFLTVAEELHFGRASEVLGISQPSLSSNIKELEKSLNVELFNRDARQVSLTKSGDILKSECYKILNQYELSINKVIQSGRLERNTIRLGVISAALTNEFMSIINDFKYRFPCYDIHFSELPPIDQKLALENKEIDVGICRFADTINIHPLSAISVIKESMYLAVSTSHSLSNRKLVSLKELKNETFAITDRSRSASPNYIISCLEQEGVTPVISNEVIDPTTLLAFISSGQSISIVPNSFSYIKFSNVKMIRIKENISSDICALYDSRVRNPLIMEFVEFMRSRQ